MRTLKFFSTLTLTLLAISTISCKSADIDTSLVSSSETQSVKADQTPDTVSYLENETLIELDKTYNDLRDKKFNILYFDVNESIAKGTCNPNDLLDYLDFGYGPLKEPIAGMLAIKGNKNCLKNANFTYIYLRAKAQETGISLDLTTGIVKKLFRKGMEIIPGYTTVQKFKATCKVVKAAKFAHFRKIHLDCLSESGKSRVVLKEM